jgi:hypothetical protein
VKFQSLENFASGGDKNLIVVLQCLLSPSRLLVAEDEDETPKDAAWRLAEE